MVSSGRNFIRHFYERIRYFTISQPMCRGNITNKGYFFAQIIDIFQIIFI